MSASLKREYQPRFKAGGRDATDLAMEEGQVYGGAARASWLRYGREALAWKLLLPAAAACVIDEWLPEYRTEHGVDLASTAANVVGAFIEGMLFRVETVTQSPSLAVLCKIVDNVDTPPRQSHSRLRHLFLNVFTSFPFVAVHGGEICALQSGPIAVGFVATSLALAVTAFELGRQTVMLTVDKTIVGGWSRLSTPDGQHRIKSILLVFVAVSLLKSNLETSSFWLSVDTESAVSRASETLVGFILAVAGVNISAFANARSTATNFVACFLVAFAFLLKGSIIGDQRLSSMQSLIFSKFVGSFCGAVSGFAGFLSDVGRDMHKAKNSRYAVGTLVANFSIAVFWMSVFFHMDKQLPPGFGKTRTARVFQLHNHGSPIATHLLSTGIVVGVYSHTLRSK